MTETNWHGKSYYSLDAYLKNTYNYKCYKVALNAHMTCPNRDGTLGSRGCIFCSAGGSGDFAVDVAGDIAGQLEEGIRLIEKKLPANESNPTPNIIAYFQAYTNTYAPVGYLQEIFTAALSQKEVCGISIATRPDCLPTEVLDLLAELKAQFPEKFIWVELGLQTIHEETAHYIRRGYVLPCFEEAKQMVLEACLEDSNICMIGWDIALSDKGPLIIEANRWPGFDLVQVLADRGRMDIVRDVLARHYRKDVK